MEIIYPRGSLGTKGPTAGCWSGQASRDPFSWAVAHTILTPLMPGLGILSPVLLALSPEVLAVPSPSSGNISVPDAGKWGVHRPTLPADSTVTAGPGGHSAAGTAPSPQTLPPHSSSSAGLEGDGVTQLETQCPQGCLELGHGLSPAEPLPEPHRPLC